MNQNLTIGRLLLGYLIAPLATPLFFLSLSLITNGRNGVDGVGEFLFFATIFAYVAAFVLGTLLILILGKIEKTKALHFAVGGMVIGGLMGVLFLPLLPWFVLAGAFSAWVFWVMVFWKSEASS